MATHTSLSSSHSEGGPFDGSSPIMSEPSDPVHFRQVMGHFCSGLAVVTSIDGTQPVGLVVQSLASLSMTPPLLSFAPSVRSTSWARIRSAGHFCVVVLAEDQEWVSRQFAQSGGNKFLGVDWHKSPLGAPVLDDGLSWADCVLEAEYPAGDHTIVVGRIVNLRVERAAPPLLFYRGKYGRLSSGAIPDRHARGLDGNQRLTARELRD
jgi:3-hydroxy-9,10-secoandrosta-1,3,5(10)-triene-9,17-dione monooxygenase reductase component